MTNAKIRMIGISVTATVLVAANLLIAPARSEDKSAVLYKQKCAACHVADGKADPPTGKSMKVRGFADPAVAKMSDEDLAGVVAKGKGKMLGYGKGMKRDEIKEMWAFVPRL